MPAAAAVILGVLLGLLSGGRMRSLGGLRLRGTTFILLAFVLQALARGRFPNGVGMPGLAMGTWVIASLLLVLALLANSTIPGCIVCAYGVMANVGVVLANGIMPFGALGTGAMQAMPGEGSTAFYGHITTATLVGFAGDVMPLKLQQTVVMMSLGDVLLVVGVCAMIVAAMLGDIDSETSAETNGAGQLRN